MLVWVLLGVIVKDNEEDLAEKFMLPPKRRWQALMDMLHFLVGLITCFFLFCFY